MSIPELNINEIIMIPAVPLSVWLFIKSFRMRDKVFAFSIMVGAVTQAIAYYLFTIDITRENLYFVYTVAEFYLYAKILMDISLLNYPKTLIMVTIILILSGNEVLLTRLECVALMALGTSAMIVLIASGSGLLNRLDYWMILGMMAYSFNVTYDHSTDGMLLFSIFNALSLSLFITGIIIRICYKSISSRYYCSA